MSFKADWSFLEKISMGAVSSQTVINKLNEAGHQVVELERYSTSNKIWSTKIKRLRLPDLICLKCGKRIESRAKSSLAIKMSDSENNPERRWDIGLRDEDLVAFIQCVQNNGDAFPSNIVNLFSVKSLRDTVSGSRLGPPKSAYEGAERDREWKTCVPKKVVTILGVEQVNNTLKIRVRYNDGRTHTYSYNSVPPLNPYCKVNDVVEANNTIIAGLPLSKESLCCNGNHYDFLEDLTSEDSSIRYAGVKALGYLAPNPKSIRALSNLLECEVDHRIILETYSSLIRLGKYNFWEDFYKYSVGLDDEYKLEFALILGELAKLDSNNKSTYYLYKIANDKDLAPEIRAAAVWNIPVNEKTLNNLLNYSLSDTAIISTHAIAHIIDKMEPILTRPLANLIVDDGTGRIIQKILSESLKIDVPDLVQEYLTTENSLKRKWLLLTIGLSNENLFIDFIHTLKHNDLSSYTLIKFLWDYKTHSLSPEDEQSIEFLKKQIL